MDQDKIVMFVERVFAKYGVPSAEVGNGAGGMDVAGPSGATR
jgi:hypothetical protein